MGRKDRESKSYFDNPTRFADVFNGYFGGGSYLKADQLEDVDTVMVGKQKQKVFERIADFSKKQLRDGSLLAVYMLENQISVDYSMVVRLMQEESLAYDKQIKAIQSRHHIEWEQKRKLRQELKSNPEKGDRVQELKQELEIQQLIAGEYLYKIRKEDRLKPVLILMIYWGDEPWDGATSLYDLLNFGQKNNGIPDQWKKYITNYHINVLDLNTWKDFSVFHTEIRTVFELFTRRNDKKEFMNYLNRQCRNMDKETADMVEALTGIKKLYDKAHSKKGEDSNHMWKAIEDLIEDGREEGRQQGLAQTITVAVMNMSEKGYSVQTISELLGKPEDLILRIQELIPGKTEKDCAEIADILTREKRISCP